jgi:hypothetical protein
VENKEILSLKGKLRRLAQTDDQWRAKVAREALWRAEHREELRAMHKAAKRAKSPWQIGMAVWHLYAGVWCEGTLLGISQGGAFDIVLLGGTQIRTCYRTLRRDRPAV